MPDTTDSPFINNIQQYLFIRGKKADNPLLLYLHGGPGSPDYCFVQDILAPLEESFTICYWEQRGAGKSNKTLHDAATLTLQQLVADTAAVTRYLLQKFQQPKLYLLGHSWGSFLGAHVIHTHPQLYHAFLSIGTVTDQLASEKESYEFVMEEAVRRKNKRLAEKLSRFPPPDQYAGAAAWSKYLQFQRRYVIQYGGTFYRRNPIWFMIKKLLLCREYTIGDKIRYFKGGQLSLLRLWDDIIHCNVNVDLKQQSIPVYFFHGRHDKHTSYQSAVAYFELLEAPAKQFYTFDDAAHFPHVECFLLFQRIITHKIQGK